MSNGLGTPNGVVSDEHYRVNIAGMVAGQTSSVAARTGVMWGPGSSAILSGTSATGTMTVNVGVHHWVTSRAAADGIYLGAKETSSTVNIAAAPGSNSRIDVVYAKQNDAGSTISPDGSTGELYGVVTGTAAVSPVKPSLPVGAVEIGTVTVAAGATSTLGAGVTINNTAALTVARGADIPVRNQAERDALTTFPFLTVKRLDTGKIEARNVGNTAWVTIYDPAPAAPSWTTLAPAANWATYVGSGGTITSGPYETFSYRQEGNRVWLRGWLNTTNVAAAGSAITAALPVSLRPPKGRTIWPAFEVGGSQGASVRCEVFTNGVIYTNRGVASGLFFNFDGISYDI